MNGTASKKMSTGQFRELAGAVLRSLPDDLISTTVQIWIEDQERLRKALYEILVSPVSAISVVPNDDEWFEIEVDDTTDPIRNIGHGHEPEKWEYLTTSLKEKRLYRVKLMRFGCVRDVDEAREKADKLGYHLVEGQAWEPFKKKFPKPSDRDLICFGGSEWQHNKSRMKACIFCVGDQKGEWYSNLFRSNDTDSNEKWRWLVTNK